MPTTGGAPSGISAERHDRAILEYNRALERDSRLVGVYADRAAAWFAKGEDDAALVDLNQAIRLDPSRADVYRLRGDILSDRRDYDRAMADYDQAIRLDPNDAPAHNGRGWVWHAKGEHDKAMSDYDRAVQLDPRFAAAYVNRGLARADDEDWTRHSPTSTGRSPSIPTMPSPMRAAAGCAKRRMRTPGRGRL